jgi:hypothetical protein
VDHHLVPFCYLIIDADAEIGEGLAELTHEALDILGAALEGRPVGLVGEVAVEDFVGKLQAAMIPDLLDVTPEDGLVFFFGGHAFLLLANPLSLGRVMALLMLPAQEAWRISGEALFTQVRGR